MSDSDDRQEMNLHMANDEPEIIYCEEYTDKKYPDYSYRKRPNFFYTKITENRNKKFQCRLCNFETNNLVSIQRHFLRHSNTRPYNCQNCDYAARVKDSLKRHMLQGCGKQTFTAGREHQCNLCEYSTFKKTNLQHHHRCHTGERPFSCDKCDFRAARKYTLKKHKRVHTKRNKTFECGECNHGYKNKNDLIQHVRREHLKSMNC